jgi:hypothetical protein
MRKLAPRLFVKSMSCGEFHQRAMGSKEDPRRGSSTDSVLFDGDTACSHRWVASAFQ